MKAKWVFSIRGRVPLTASIILGAIPILLMLGTWCFLTAGAVEDRIIDPITLPSPAEVFSLDKSIVPLLRDRDLGEHILVSLKRVSLAYLLAVAVSLPLGIVMASFGSMRAMFSPTTTASGYIPISTLVPLTIAWFGTDEKQKIVFLAIAFVIYLVPVIIRAVDGVPDVYLRTASTLGASRLQIIWRILVPVALPDIWHGMRLAFGVGWTYLVLAEVVVYANGLGYLIAFSQRRGPREHIYLVIIVITLIAWLADLAWSRLGKVLFPYKKVTSK